MNLSSVSMGAASTVTLNYAAQSASIAAVGQNPDADTVAGEDQTGNLAQASMDVLKKAINVQASTGAQLAQMIGQGSGVDILA